MFTQKDLQKAIEYGIFSKSNDVTGSPAAVIRFFETWAKEREAKIRHIAAEIAITAESKDSAHRDIMNINISE